MTKEHEMDKLRAVIKQIRNLDYPLMRKAQDRLDNLTKPVGSLGRLEELARLVVGITGKDKPVLTQKVIFTLAADHGVAQEKVSAYPQEVTAQMVYNFLRGQAAINVLARHIRSRVVVVDMAVAEKIPNPKSQIPNFKNKKINYGTKNMTKGPAMTRKEAIKSIEAGMDVLEEELIRGVDIVGTGEMGIGNTTAASAITAVLAKKAVRDVTGRGTGINDKILENKIKIIKTALRINRPKSNDPIDVLSKVGGFEIAGLVGIILSAASHRIPVVLDGFISGAAGLLAYHIDPRIKRYMIASHCSAEKGHRIILSHIGLDPILDLDLRLGEGTGAALGITIIEAAVKILNQMATFQSAGVSGKG